MTPEQAKQITKFLQKYNKPYGGTMFSAPMPQDLERAVRVSYGEGADGIMWAVHYTHSPKKLKRKSFTGEVYEIPADILVAQHVGRTAGVLPDMSKAEPGVVYVYQEDQELVKHLTGLGYKLMAVRIGATAEVQGVYGGYFAHPEDIPLAHEPADEATLVRMPDMAINRGMVLGEVKKVTGFRDDYPYYNKKNAWGAASLRGYKPHDPLYGLKPKEMSRAWWREHPEDAVFDKCENTVLADACPALMGVLVAFQNYFGGTGFERVRLLRLAPGELLRHCDITDRDLGTRTGQVARFHIPLVTNPEVRTISWDHLGVKHERNFGPWEMYYMDIRKPHAARNPGSAERIHLQIDAYVDDRLRNAIIQAHHADLSFKGQEIRPDKE